MAAPQTAQPIPLGVPLGGFNAADDILQMGMDYASWMENFIPDPQVLRVRHGFGLHADLTTKSDYVLGLGAYDGKLFAYVQTPSGALNNQVYDVTAAGVPAAAAFTCADDTADEAYPVKYGKRFSFVGETDFADCNAVLSSGTWGAWGFTSGGSPIGGRVVVSYRGRVFIFNGTTLYWSIVGGVTGACTSSDYASLFEEEGSIVWAGVLTNPKGTAQDTCLAFGNAAGEVLVYSGTDPAATSWTQVGKFKIPPLLHYNSVLQIQNDIWIATKAGLYSLRRLFTVGPEGAEKGKGDLTISTKIDPYWMAYAASVGDFGSKCSMVYWPEQNKVYILLNKFRDSSGVLQSDSATLLVYDLGSKAWGVCRILKHVGDTDIEVSNLTYLNNGLYLVVSSASRNKRAIVKMANEHYSDYHFLYAETQFPWVIESAYTNLGSSSKFKQLVGFEVLTKASAAQIKMKAQADAGRASSNLTSIAPVDGLKVVNAVCGVQGVFFGYRIECGGMPLYGNRYGFELRSVGAIVV